MCCVDETRLRFTCAADGATTGQDCSIARALEVVGERWTLLVLRESFFGTSRFDDFQRRLGIARNVLQARLELLVDEGILVRSRYLERPPRYEYKLTQEGRTWRRCWWRCCSGATATGRLTGPPVAIAHAAVAGRSTRRSCASAAASRSSRASIVGAVAQAAHAVRATRLSSDSVRCAGRRSWCEQRRRVPGAASPGRSWAERVGDRAAAVQAQRCAQLAVLLGQQGVAGERRGVVEVGEAAQRPGVGLLGQTQHDGVGRGVVVGYVCWW